MTEHPDALYMHIVNDANAGDLDLFPAAQTPVAFEIVYDSMNDPQAQADYWERATEISEVWVNTMWSDLASGETDEASLRSPALGWQAVVDRGARLMQTDNVQTMAAWRDGIDVTKLGLHRGSIRVQAEDYVNEASAYSDTDPNTCGPAAIADLTSPVDACDLDGAYVVQYIREGEWFTLRVDAPQRRRYRLVMRHSSDTEPGGTVQIDTGAGWSAPHALPNTTHDRNFELADLGRYSLEAGTNEVRLRFSHPDSLSVDWVQFDRR
jgi:glycerophosphoryl diester phosphodiesterase